ncbi:cytochrome c oxidase subunit II [Pedosphaera parvula]|uniref:Cytochrome c oxidase subunit 2 n=1 Tax=Pedosphaera parvula (strain Ellin514) TaxID=320771 RepID=B9XE51_PEDPL|nr:cytochrome c oxidase subunit II [Pedosphaera parvula]EEF61942.1 cytochrome c oxidase, subunit II [Pedosphaera parvula Ellin514]
MNFPLFPHQASSIATKVDTLFIALVLLSLVLLAIIFGPMFYFLFKYRRGNKADRRPLNFATWKIEVTWTLVPLFLVLGIYSWAATVYFDLERPPANALEINVIGKQWMWKLQHAEGNREINELHVPLGKVVKLTMASQDVIHSFFIPAFRIKQDVVPGRYVTEWFRPTRLGTYHLFCAEYCGTSHSGMTGSIIVMRPDEYQQWLANGRPQENLAQTGERLFRELGCSGCHMGSGQVRAPRLEGVFGKPVPLQGGQWAFADEKYIRDSILLPQSQIAAGYEPVMPTYQGHISEEELLQLIAYVKSLANKQPLEETK